MQQKQPTKIHNSLLALFISRTGKTTLPYHAPEDAGNPREMYARAGYWPDLSGRVNGRG